MPNLAPDGPLNTNKKGLLSPLGDPLGQVLDKGLGNTVGHLTGGVGRPSGEALENVQEAAKNDYGYKSETVEEQREREKPGGERIGGNTQTGKNPLGL